MRDYGVVRTGFWEWAKRQNLDAEVRELALYLLTSPHGNAAGCFRLPMAYLCDDLGKDAKTAARCFQRLQKTGFAARDEATGWTWVTGYLRHNPIPNRNVGKAVEKQFDAVPAAVSFYADLIESLRSIVDESLAERYRDRFDTVSRRPKTQTQIQTRTQTQEQEQDHSEAEASDAGASRHAVEGGRREIFAAGTKILVDAGIKQAQARGMLGKWCKAYSDEAVLAAIRQVQGQSVAEPVSFITACLKARKPPPDDEDAVPTEEAILAMGKREGWWDGVL